MENENEARAPYNFVPFSDGVLEYREELPAHNILDPALKTGEIHVCMTAQTPVFVSDGKKEPHFFKDMEGRYVLPGSTVRGMVRANMQVLGFGVTLPGEDMEDRRLYYREFAASKDALRFALKDHYKNKNALNIESGTTFSGHHYSNPRNVRTGYLQKSASGGYEILPAQYYRVTKDFLTRAGLGECHAEAFPVDYKEDCGEITFIRRAAESDKPAPGTNRGMLLCPGVDTGGDGTSPNRKTGKIKPPAHRYVFGEVSKYDVARPIPKEDEISYRMDWEYRKNDLKGGSQIEGRKILYDPNFWALPEHPGEKKPVFYLSYLGHIYFGMTRFPRLGYDHTLAEGLPYQHRKVAKNGYYPYDYIRAILGYAGDQKSYRSRVSFRDFRAVGSPQEEGPVTTIPGGPKPSWFAAYTVDGKHYNENNFRLSGQKRYWMKETAKAVEPPNDNENYKRELRPLPTGTVFRGVIRYKNLRPHELGLLLWALRLEDGCFQSVGMGKNFGYGRMNLEIERLWEYDMGALYQDLAAGPAEAEAEAVETYIKRYQNFARNALGESGPIRELSEIKDFFYLCSKIQPDSVAGYMQIGDKKKGLRNEYQNLKLPLPTVADFREPEEIAQRMDERAKQKAAEDEQKRKQEAEELQGLSMEELVRRFNQKNKGH